MRYLIYAMFIVGMLAASAQSNLAFFTEEGENFTLFVNGVQINQAPNTNVEAKNISGEFAQVKVVFETPGAPVLKQGMLVESGKEMTLLIKKNRKGKYVFRMVSSSYIQKSAQTETIPITNTSQPTASVTSASQGVPASDNQNNETIGINMNIGDQSVGVSVSMSGFEDSASNETGSSSNTVSSRYQQLSARVDGNNIILSDGRKFTCNYYNANRIGPVVEMKDPVGAQVTISYDGVNAYQGEVPFQYKENDYKKSSSYFKLTVNEGSAAWSVKLKHSGKIIIDGPSTQAITPTTPVSASSGCATPMSDGDFNRSKQSIEGKSFGDEQLTVFRQIVRSNCFSVSQVIGFMDLFSYEDEKLEVAKLAYPKTVDKGNYFQLNDALSYADSVEALESFLANQ